VRQTALTLGQQLITGIPGLGTLLPWALVVPTGGFDTSVTGAIIAGQPIEASGAIVMTAVASVV
jgi:hypothetical protein